MKIVIALAFVTSISNPGIELVEILEDGVRFVGYVDETSSSCVLVREADASITPWSDMPTDCTYWRAS